MEDPWTTTWCSSCGHGSTRTKRWHSKRHPGRGNAVDPTQPCNVNTFPGVRPVADGLNWLVAEHIARHNPARVLAEVEAKRRVVQALGSAEVSLRNTEPGKGPHELMTGAANSLRAAVRMLAAAYADHPDYRDEWRP